MKDRLKPTRYYSNRQEKYVANKVDGYQTTNSGATRFKKGDISCPDILIECKTSVTEKNSFSVKKEDWWLFYDEARQVLNVFEKKPILKGGASNISLSNKVLDFGQKGYIVNYEPYSYRDKTYAFMGNILYPIEFGKLDLDEKTKSYISSNNIIIKFEIGELDITPSREHLS